METNAQKMQRAGRLAGSPWQIDVHGWMDICSRVVREVIEDRVLLVAGGVAFYALLSIVPGITALVSLYGMVADTSLVNEQISRLDNLVPADTLAIVQAELSRLADQPHTGLGITGAVSLIVAIWMANAAVKALFEAMNVAYEEKEARSYVRFSLVSLAFTFGAVLTFIGASAVVIALPTAINFLGLDNEFIGLARWAASGVMLLVLMLVVSGLYRWGPSRNPANWRWITPGASLAIVGATVGSAGFSWYVENIGNFSQTYGSLGAIVGFMTWLWLMAIVVIVGAQVNAEMEHQTASDTTTGAGRPIGERGAVMADTVGAGRRAAPRALRPYVSQATPDTHDAMPERARLKRHQVASNWLWLPLAVAVYKAVRGRR